MTAQMPPGWYDDPDGSPNAERRWDGHNWTPERRRKTTHTPPPAYAQPPQAQAWYPQPDPQPWYPQPPYPQSGQAQAWYPQPPQAQASYPQYVPPPYLQPGQAQPTTTTAASNLFSIIAFVCAGIAVLAGFVVMAPVAFGVAGLILGVVGLTKKERLAPFAIGAAVGGTILGWIFQAALWSSAFY